MTSAQPPTYWFSGINYNPNLFATSTDSYVTLSYANSNYLKSYGSTTSSATTTTFYGFVSALQPASLISIGNTTPTTSDTSATAFFITFVPTNATSAGQQFFTDGGIGTHFNYTPSTNNLQIGSSAVGSLNITNTTGSLQIKGSSASALYIPNGTANVFAVNLLNPPAFSYASLPTYTSAMCGYTLSVSGTLVLTTCTTGTYYSITSTTPLFASLPAGTYHISSQVFLRQGTGVAGTITSILGGLSTSSSSFVGGFNQNIMGYKNVATTTGSTFIQYYSRIYSNAGVSDYYYGIIPTFTGLTMTLTGADCIVTFLRIS